MIEKLEELGSRTLKEIEALDSLQALESVRVNVLGKKGSISEILKGLGSLGPADRPKVGAAANVWKTRLEEALEARRGTLESAELDRKLKSERIDTTLPSRLAPQGGLHPITQTTRRIIEVFRRLGFDTTTGPEVETDFLNFEAVNVPQDHPARDMQDTFFLGPDVVLRTHTSAIQMRQMLARKWPVRVLCPGAVYRKDSDATHSPMFHQIEGLWVDKHVRLSDLRGVLDFFAREIFGPEAKVRMRPSYFPFVEPGCEVDVYCKGRGWLEILGAGMVHPRLFETAGYDPREVSGFAFGMGIERVAMILHDIPDLRLMFQNHNRFLSQF